MSAPLSVSGTGWGRPPRVRGSRPAFWRRALRPIAALSPARVRPDGALLPPLCWVWDAVVSLMNRRGLQAAATVGCALARHRRAWPRYVSLLL